MSEPAAADFEQQLRARPESDWQSAYDRLAPRIHEIDRDATRIWMAFWPPKLTHLLQSADDPLQTAQELLLYGEYELAKVLPRSVDFLYGGRYWDDVRAAVLAHADSASPDTKDIADHVEAVAARLDADRELVTGIALVALLAFSQVGAEAFATARRHARHPLQDRTPERILAERARERSQGWLGFLRTVDRRHDVRWDETDPKRVFEAIHGQDITMAGANASGDFSEMDARRVEGPVPIQCRNGACGFCWVGVLYGAGRLSEMTPFERRRMAIFGYLAGDDADETHPPVRLACQARVEGDVTIVVPPWNGVLNGRS